MMPLANKPLLQYQVELLRKHGLTDVVFCSRGQVAAIRQHFGRGDRFGVRIAYSIENKPLGTAGAIRYAEPYLRHDTAVVMNGDGLIDHDLSSMMRFHARRRADATIGLVEVCSPTPCGLVMTGVDDKVVSFDEPGENAKKTVSAGRYERTGCVTVNGGVYVITRAALRSVPFGTKCSIEKQFFPSLINDGCRVYGFRLAGYWLDIGNPSSYLSASRDLLAGKVDVEVLGKRTAGGYWTTGDVHVDHAEIEPCAHLGAGSVFGPGSRIVGFTAVGPGCVVGEGSIVDGCVLLENVSIGAGCTLRGCIVGQDARIGDRVQLADSVVGSGSSILASVSATTAERVQGTGEPG